MDRQNMHARHLERVADWLNEAERPMNTGLAQSVQIAQVQAQKRGGGEGVLVLTDQRLLFRDDATDRGISIPLEDVVRVGVHRIVVPRLRSVKVTVEGGEFEFYVGRVFAQELLGALSPPSGGENLHRINKANLATAVVMGIFVFVAMSIYTADVQRIVSPPVYYAYVVAGYFLPIAVGVVLYRILDD